MTHISNRVSFMLLLSFLTACTQKKSTDRSVVQPGAISPTMKIVGGANANSKDFPSAVGLLFIAGTGASFCSGTVIGPNRILTAAHCLEDLTQANQIIYIAAADAALNTQQVTLKDDQNHSRTVNFYLSPVISKYYGIGDVGEDSAAYYFDKDTEKDAPGYGYPGNSKYDAAILEVDVSLAAIQAATLNINPVVPGENIYFEGMGCTKYHDARFFDVGTFKAAVNVVQPLQSLSEADLGAYFLGLRGGADLGNFKVGSICPGDSGGGAYRMVNGQMQLVGVASSVSNGNPVESDFTRLTTPTTLAKLRSLGAIAPLPASLVCTQGEYYTHPFYGPVYIHDGITVYSFKLGQWIALLRQNQNSQDGCNAKMPALINDVTYLFSSDRYLRIESGQDKTIDDARWVNLTSGEQVCGLALGGC